MEQRSPWVGVAGAGPQPGADPLRLPGQPALGTLGLRPHPMDAAKGPSGPGHFPRRGEHDRL